MPRRSARKVYNRAADTLRLCLQSLTHSKTGARGKISPSERPLGRSQSHCCHGPPSHPCGLSHTARYGRPYVKNGIAEYEIKSRLQRLKWLRREAKSLEMQLLPA